MTDKNTALVVAPSSGSVIVSAPGIAITLPALAGAPGSAAAEATLEFFTARIPNANTRQAYGRAVVRFGEWCEDQGLGLEDVTPPVIAAYLQALAAELSTPTVKQHLAALRHWLDWLTQRGAISQNPATSVRGPRHIVHEGKTPVLDRDQARALFASLEGEGLHTRRDRALIATMLFGFVRVGAVVKMRVRDFQDEGRDAWLLLQEKGGKRRRIPCHHQTAEYLRAYLQAAGLHDPRSKAPLFQSGRGRGEVLSGRAMSRADVLAMIKRRCSDAGLPPTICNHSFRATGITLHQESGGRIEDAAELAGHASTRTTQLYNRKRSKLARAEVERVQI